MDIQQAIEDALAPFRCAANNRRWIVLLVDDLDFQPHHVYGLPQDSVLSPLLAMLFVDRLDEAIEARGYRLICNVDDFVVMYKSEDVAREPELLQCEDTGTRQTHWRGTTTCPAKPCVPTSHADTL